MQHDEKLLAIAGKIAAMMKPPPPLDSAQWADEFMVLPEEAAQRGRLSNSIVPWAYGIAQLIQDTRYHVIVLVQGVQTGKTQMLMNYICFRMDTDPVAMMYIMPTQQTLERFSRRRLGPTLRAIPSLSDATASGQQDKITEKLINGMPLSLGWAGSGSQLRSTPAGVVIIDEIDVMPSIKGEGDVFQLASRRTSTFPNRKIIVTSTTTEGNCKTYRDPGTDLEHWEVSDAIQSRVWQLMQQGTRHEWMVPDLGGCGRYFAPRRKHFYIPEDSTPQEARKGAKLICPHCGHELFRGMISKLNAAGRLVAPGQWVDSDGNVQGEAPEASMASVWVSGLASPFPGADWGRIAEDYRSAELAGDVDQLRVVINTDFGEPFTPVTETVEWDALLRLRRDYAMGTVPKPVRVITVGCDVGGDYVMYSVRGWGHGLESYLIDWGTIDGDTSKPAVWEALTMFLAREYGGLSIEMLAIDSGYNPDGKLDTSNSIYEFARLNRSRVVAIRGKDVLNDGKVYYSSKVDINYKGDLIKRGLRIFHLNSDVLKSMLYTRLSWPDNAPGGLYLPRNVPEEYMKQVTAETRTVNRKTGRPEWVKLRANHALDCEYINFFLAKRLNLWARYPLDNRPPPSVQPGRVVDAKADNLERAGQVALSQLATGKLTSRRRRVGFKLG